MHILFIYPPYKKEEVFSYLSDNAPILPPLGIAYLAAYLRQHSYTVSIIDAPVMNLSIGQIVKKALSENPRIIGITANSPLYSRALILARELKLSLPGCKIVLGGYHPTFLGEEVLKNNFVDFIVRGEGEKTLLALMRALEGKENYFQIKGLGFRFQDRIILNEPGEFIDDLDCLPFPAYDLLPIEKYRTGNSPNAGRKAISIIASRGCRGNCYFCTSPGFWKNKFRTHSPEYIISLMNHLYINFRKDSFHFRDDTFTLNRGWVVGFCNSLQKNRYKYKWDCYSRFDTIDDDLLKMMKQSGCFQISLGVESSNDAIIRDFKGFSKSKVYEGMKLIKKHGLKTRLFFMAGPPARTFQDIDNIADFAIELDPNVLVVTASIAYPGSRFYSSIKEKGQKLEFEKKIPRVYEGYHGYDNFNQQYIKTKIVQIYKRFYLRPRYILKHLFSIRSTEDALHLFLGIIFLFKMLKKEVFSENQN